jgi:hypothetical protein
MLDRHFAAVDRVNNEHMVKMQAMADEHAREMRRLYLGERR